MLPASRCAILNATLAGSAFSLTQRTGPPCSARIPADRFSFDRAEHSLVGVNRFLATPSPHGRLVLRAWLAAERDAARTRPTSALAAAVVPVTVAGRSSKPGAHGLPSPHFAPLVGAARKFAAAPKACAKSRIVGR
ncbi:MAG: hypothetical protein C0483_25060 [Pirellula sp.]|nr:hypothetical protein [Pirellula sp.]